jgi:hypothetical protein
MEWLQVTQGTVTQSMNVIGSHGTTGNTRYLFSPYFFSVLEKCHCPVSDSWVMVLRALVVSISNSAQCKRKRLINAFFQDDRMGASWKTPVREPMPAGAG